MSQREDDPKIRPPKFDPIEDEPTNLIPTPDVPSGRSLGEDPTSLNAGTLSGLRIEPSGASDTALVRNPDPSGIEIAEPSLLLTPDPSTVDNSSTALLLLPSPNQELSTTTDMPIGKREELSASEQRMAKSYGVPTLPMDTRIPDINRDATEIRSTPLTPPSGANDVTGLLQVPVGRNEPSLGAKVTQAAEATAVRPVFAQLVKSDDRGRRKREISRPGDEGGAASSPKFWIAVLSLILVGLGGFLAHNYYSQKQRAESLHQSSRAAVEKAQQSGRPLDLAAADKELRALLVEQPTDGVALSVRALMLAEALYEYGGSGDFAAEVQSAVRQSEGENRPAAIAAQLFLALARADLKLAEITLTRLTALPAGAATAEELAPLPLGLRDYLNGGLLRIAGRDGEAIDALRNAVAKTKLPLWQRRLAEALHRQGRDAEALPHLVDVEQREPDLCGVQIDLAVLRGRTGSALRSSLAALRSNIEPPRRGDDPCGRADHARAALGAAELVLWSEPTGRNDARNLLDQAEKLTFPQDVVFAAALAQARLHAGDFAKAEQLSLAALDLVPTRRGTRLLLARALIGRDRGSEALTVLEPLTAPSDSGTNKAPLDLEAQLLRAQGFLKLNDTLEAQKLGRRILASSGIPGAVRTDAQLLLAQVYLRLSEPAAARRTLEPLVQKAGAADSTTAEPNGTRRDQLLDAQVLWAQTLLLLKPPEQQEARALLEAVVGQAPERAPARTVLGKLLRDIGEWSQAEQQLSAAMRTDETYTPARRELAALLMQRGDYAKAHALFRELVKDEQDAELLLASARAERLDGAAEQALATLASIKRGRGEVQSKYDEALLIEKARSLLSLDRPGEAETLLRGPASDLPGLRRPTLPALYIRALVSGIVGPGRAPAIAQARALLGRMPPVWRSDADLRLAECELLLAEDNKAAARLGLEALSTSLQNVPATSQGEEMPLRQRADKLIAELPASAGSVAKPVAKPQPKGRR